MGKLRNQSSETTLSISAEGSRTPASPLLTAFANAHSIRMKRDSCGDWEALGKLGSVTDFGDGVHLHVTVIPESSRWWTVISKQAKAAGCLITQSGDAEGCYIFNPTMPEQTEVALKAISPRFKRHGPANVNFRMVSL